jgi:NCS1 family nucleobase:cation symporter-1
VSPSYDFSNAWPKLISLRTGGLITGVLGILIQPWHLLANPHLYVFTWLGFYGGATGAIAGVLIADYWLLRRTNLRLADLYKPLGIYRYASGWNWRAVAALTIGIVLAVGGAYSAIDPATGLPTGPFPDVGLIPFLKPLYDYSWVVGLVAAFLSYWLFATVSPRTEPTAQAMAEQAA